MNYRPAAETHGYRGVEYGVFERAPGDWEWTYHPKMWSSGEITRGSAKGDREAAIAACKAAIDAWLGPERP
jgi:hypothetical protein